MIEYGKIPPQSIEIEEAVLGAMILERDCFINNPVKKDWFYKEEHQKIIECVEWLVNESIPIDLIQVTKRLHNTNKLDEIGGALYLTQLTSKVSSAINIAFYIRILQQDYARRELIRITHSINQMCYDQSIDIDDVFGSIQHELSGIMSFGDDNTHTYKDATNDLISCLNTNIQVGIKTGFNKFDKFAGGLHNSDLIIIAGETSQGKTSFALTAIKNCAKMEFPIAIYSLEMTSKQLVSRITAQETGISSKKIMYNNLSNVEKSTVLSELLRLQNLPIYFDENSTNDIDKICTSIRKLKIKHNISLVLVDFIQDIKGAETEAGVAEIGRKLKNIAKEINIPIIAISQLARDKNNPEPTISRLRGSGQLEEKADVIMLLYRPEYYGKSYSEPHEDIEIFGTAQIKIAKGRNIGIGSFILRFNKETTNFYDYEAIIEEVDNYMSNDMSDKYSKMPINDNFENEHLPF